MGVGWGEGEGGGGGGGRGRRGREGEGGEGEVFLKLIIIKYIHLSWVHIRSLFNIDLLYDDNAS